MFQAFFSESKVLNYSFWIQPTLSSFSPTQKQSPRALNFTNGSDGCNSVALHMISQIPSVTSTPSSTFHNFQKQLHRTLSSRTLVVPSIHQINRSVSTLNAAIGKKYRFTVHMGTCLGFIRLMIQASLQVWPPRPPKLHLRFHSKTPPFFCENKIEHNKRLYKRFYLFILSRRWPLKILINNNLLFLFGWALRLHLGLEFKINFFYYLDYFCYYSTYFMYYSWIPLYFLILFMDFTVLFQIGFTFIYSTFNKKNFNFN